MQAKDSKVKSLVESIRGELGENKAAVLEISKYVNFVEGDTVQVQLKEGSDEREKMQVFGTGNALVRMKVVKIEGKQMVLEKA